jgi:hypothetical protein
MNQLERFNEIIATYSRHGWSLQRVLMRAETRASAKDLIKDGALDGVEIKESTVDALWFSRPSHAGREAWELRHVADAPYALFETFEPDEAEEDREEVRREMLARLRERVGVEG